MKKRKLGSTDLEVYPFAFGGNVFGWTANENTSFELLDQYTELGFNFIDTADVYSAWVAGNKGGESETIIGKWIHQKRNRDKLVIATKVGAEIDSSHKGLKKSYILSEVEESLNRLQTDYIDLYFTHFDDPDTPIEEVLEAYQQLIKEGKIRYIGVSNMSPERIINSLEISKTNNLPSYTVLQPEYNLYDRESYEKDYEPIAEKYNLGVMTYYSLASGFLTGKYHSESDLNKSKRGDGLKKYLNERGRHIIKTLEDVAARNTATPAQVAIAWIIQRPSITAPIASASKLGQLDILKSVDINLSKDDISVLDAASKVIP
jgi:aryl-alcohol dehydrogenase-like predicted oxidoreductase